MNQSHPLQPRTRFLLTLLGLLLICAIPMAITFYVLRSIRHFFRRLTGRGSGDDHARVAVAQAKKRARKAKAAYDATNRKFQRAAAKLAKAQAALDAVQKPAGERAPDGAAEMKSSSPAQFWFGVGKWIANYLIERQMKKLP